MQTRLFAEANKSKVPYRQGDSEWQMFSAFPHHARSATHDRLPASSQRPLRFLPVHFHFVVRVGSAFHHHASKFHDHVL